METKRIIVWHTTDDRTARTSYYRASLTMGETLDAIADRARIDRDDLVLVSVSEPVLIMEVDLTAWAAEVLEGRTRLSGARALLGWRGDDDSLMVELERLADLNEHLVLTEAPF